MSLLQLRAPLGYVMTVRFFTAVSMHVIMGVGFLIPTLHAAEQHDVLIIVGAEGNERFGKRFQAWADTWRNACERAHAQYHLIGVDTPEQAAETDKALVQRLISEKATTKHSPLWIVMIGHGTYDGRSAKFNLRGPDIAAEELSSWLINYPRPVVLLNNAPASAPFLQAVSHPGRVIITATKSGNEANATRFGGFLAEALATAYATSTPESTDSSSADLDHDGQISVLELFLSAAHAVAASYKKDGLIATEHPLIDDNGDGKGTRADWFDGVWATKSAADGTTVDGIRAHQIHLLPSPAEQQLSDQDRAERDNLELALALLRKEKNNLSEADYYQRLEKIMVQLAEIYGRAQSPPASTDTPPIP